MKGRPRSLLPLVLLGALVLVLGGCDSFSLADAYLLPGEGALALSLKADSETTLRGGTVGLTATGGTSPYSFAVSDVDLYAGTSGAGIGSVTGLNYIAGGAIGKVRITMTDAAGGTAFAYVTVLPPAPTITDGKRTGSGNTVQLTWSYPETAIIDKYRLELSVDGQAYSSLVTTVKTATSYGPYNSLVTTSTYSYRLYAVSGTYESAPASISLAPL